MDFFVALGIFFLLTTFLSAFRVITADTGETMAETLARWADHPDQFVREVFGITPDPWQDKVLKAFPHNQRLAMKACKGPGKTCLLAWLILNFLLTRPHAQVAAMSISKDNLQDNLWKELSKWMKKSPLILRLFVWTKTRIFCKEHPETWFCSARAWSKTADAQEQADTLSGLHADYMMIVMDESGGYPDAVLASAEAVLATGIECKVVQSGNPTHLEGPLYRACTKERHRWFVVEITGDPDDPDRASRIPKSWAIEQIEQWGRHNPWVLVNVFGEFPPSSFNALLGPDDVSKAMKRHLREDQYTFSEKRLGIDPARFGDDSTILFPRQGLAAFKFVEMRHARSYEIAARVKVAIAKWGASDIAIDSTGGHGAGVEDALLQSKVYVAPVVFNGKAIDTRYYNKRSEIWWEMREWVLRGGALPNDPQLHRELTAPTYTLDGGKLRVEEKEQVKARLGFSPDRADALAVTFHTPDAPISVGGHVPGLSATQEGEQTKHDYNPTESD